MNTGKRIVALCLLLSLIFTAICAAGASTLLSDDLTEIGEEAFANDQTLTAITLPETLSKIKQRAFAGCTALKEVYCYSRDAEINETAFDNGQEMTVYCFLKSTMDSYARAAGFSIVYFDAFEITCDTCLNGAPGLPITWKLKNVLPGETVSSRYVYSVYKSGTLTPVATSAQTTNTSYTWTPDAGGEYYVSVTMTNSLTVTTIESEKVPVASSLYFGIYEQDNNSSTEDPLEWTVLAVSGDKALVITKKIIRNYSYFNPWWIKYKYTYWAYSYIGKTSVNYRGSGAESAATRITGITPTHVPLQGGKWGTEEDLFVKHSRYWCNTTFYNSAFTADEKSRILLTTNVNNNNPKYGIAGGPDTKDYVFFLSYEEMLTYMPDASMRKCSQTAVAKSENKKNYSSDWWLRTPGRYRVNAMFVYGSNGSYSTSGSDVGHDCVGYRPCMWITIGG